MKMPFLFFTCIALFAGGLLFSAARAHADENSQLNAFIQTIRDNRVQVESQLGIVHPPDQLPDGVEFMGAKTDHYEQVLIMKDQIDVGIR